MLARCQKRDVLSAWSLAGNAQPSLKIDSGTHFPPGADPCVPLWGRKLGPTFRWKLNGKACPTLGSKNGTKFPRAAPLGNGGPLWSPIPGCIFHLGPYGKARPALEPNSGTHFLPAAHTALATHPTKEGPRSSHSERGPIFQPIAATLSPANLRC
mgnify:CR=1 FL=1